MSTSLSANTEWLRKIIFVKSENFIRYGIEHFIHSLSSFYFPLCVFLLNVPHSPLPLYNTHQKFCTIKSSKIEHSITHENI